MAGFVAKKNLSRITIPTEFQSEASTPPLPHFDDEATLLTARPVVPIDVVAASENIRGFLFMAGVVLAAALLGAAVAVSIVSYQNRRAAPLNAVAESHAPANPAADPETLNTSKPSAPQVDEAVASTTEPTLNAQEDEVSDIPPVQAKDIAPLNGQERSKQRSADDEAAANHQKIAGKRSERPAHRQQAAKVQRSSDADRIIERPRDAGRIREIFEGPNPF